MFGMFGRFALHERAQLSPAAWMRRWNLPAGESAIGSRLVPGALNAESFCERVLSCANDVLTEGNTLLGDAELEMLVVLRMNRNFMRFMRKHYSYMLNEQFGQTVIREADFVDDE